MTTRKALIERIKSMQLGTQEMLDAAKDDATLIPFGFAFFSQYGVVERISAPHDDDESVAFAKLEGHKMDYEYLNPFELLPITEE